MKRHGSPLSIIFLFHLCLELFCFREADEAVAIGIDAIELLAGAQEFATRHVAVAITIHLAEPERSGRWRRWALGRKTAVQREGDSAAEAPRIARPQLRR